jgi:hypothetical protein
MDEDFEQDFVAEAFGEEDDSPRPARPKPPKPQKPKPPVGTPEQVAKAKRTRNVLLALSLLLVVAVGALCWYGYQRLWPVIATPPDAGLGSVTVLPTDDDPNSGDIPLTVVYGRADVPDLVALFGLTREEALSRLGEGWVETKVSTTELPDPADPAAVMPTVYQLVTLSYTPDVLSASGGDGHLGDYAYDEAVRASLPKANVYLSLNGDGRVIEVYYAADLELLGHPDLDFMALLADDGFLRGVLGSAGIDPREFVYQPPDYAGSLTYDRPESDARKVVKQSVIFSGRALGEGLPTAWAVTVTYEFMPPAQDPSEAVTSRRIIHINLS